jgi:MoxR-like ATPase
MEKSVMNEKKLEQMKTDILDVMKEMQKIIVGQTDVLTEILAALFCKGHVLLEAVPGLGKTLMIKTLGECLSLKTTRIQFTPDLMPADIIGTNTLIQNETKNKYEISFQKGPVFTQILLADEINRATPKTQSALLEAMQECTVTVSGNQLSMDKPFIVLATQNPLEMEGTYPLPEAQLDRFFFKISVPYPTQDEMTMILERTTAGNPSAVDVVMNADTILEYQNLIQKVPVSSLVQDYAIRLIYSTHQEDHNYSRFIRYGSSPRGAQSLILGGKFFAIISGRPSVSFDDIKRAAGPALRHRMILSFEGEAEGISTDKIVGMILNNTPERL